MNKIRSRYNLGVKQPKGINLKTQTWYIKANFIYKTQNLTTASWNTLDKPVRNVPTTETIPYYQ